MSIIISFIIFFKTILFIVSILYTYIDTHSGGGNNFESKVLNCQAGNGIGAVIYNNIDGKINGGVSSKTQTRIPSFQITQKNGLLLKSTGLNAMIDIGTRKGYAFLSGTSMASPHIAGVAALIWRAVSFIDSYISLNDTYVLTFLFCCSSLLLSSFTKKNM